MKRKITILGILMAMIISISLLSVSSSTQEWAAISYYCGDQSEGAVGKTIGHTLGYAFGGVSTYAVAAGIAAGGPVAIVAGAAWGVIALS